jgi:hypothetical protein
MTNTDLSDPLAELRARVAAKKQSQSSSVVVTEHTVTAVEHDGKGNQVGVTTAPPIPANAVVLQSQPPVHLKTTGREIVYFDLETVPDERRRELFGLDPLPEVPPETPIDGCPPFAEVAGLGLDEIEKRLIPLNPESEWLDGFEQFELQQKKPRAGVAKIVSAIRTAKSARETAEAAQIKTMSVTPEMCRIAALGFAVGDADPVSLVVGIDGVTEESILEVFWGLARTATPLCGFNVLGFDLPVIFVRSAMLGVSPTRRFDLKPWGSDVLDLMVARYPRSGATRLKDLCRMLEIEVPAGETDGGAVYQLMQTEPAKVAEYVRSDITVTRKLHQIYQGFFCS